MNCVPSATRFLSVVLPLPALVAICPVACAIDVLYQGPNDGSWNVTANWNNIAPPDVAFNEAGVINNGATVVLSEHTKSSISGTPPLVDVNVGGLRLGSAASTAGGLRIVSGGILEAVPSVGAGAESGAIGIGGAGQGNLTILGNGRLTGETLSLSGTAGSNMTLSDMATVSISGDVDLQRTTTIIGPSVTFTADGNLSLSGTSILTPDIRSATSHSPLVIQGVATVDGTLRPIFTGVIPAIGNQWTLIDAATSINGTFASLDLSMAPALPAGLFYGVTEISNGPRRLLQLTVSDQPALVGDYNRDGTVDAADYVVWRDTLGQAGMGLAADGNGNREIDLGDYHVWRSNFGRIAQMVAANVASRSSKTPEPSAAVPICLAVASIFALRREPRRPAGHRPQPQLRR